LVRVLAGLEFSEAFIAHTPRGEYESSKDRNYLEATKECRVSGRQCKFLFYEPNGDERFRTLTSSHYRGHSAYVFLFDLANTSESSSSSTSWIADIGRYGPENSPLFIVGCKSDLMIKEGAGSTVSNDVESKVKAAMKAHYHFVNEYVLFLVATEASSSSCAFFLQLRLDNEKSELAMVKLMGKRYFHVSSKTKENLDKFFEALAAAALKFALEGDDWDEFTA